MIGVFARATKRYVECTREERNEYFGELIRKWPVKFLLQPESIAKSKFACIICLIRVAHTDSNQCQWRFFSRNRATIDESVAQN